MKRFILAIFAVLTLAQCAHAQQWEQGLDCDAMASLGRAVMVQKQLGTDKESLKLMTYTAALGSGRINVMKKLTDSMVELAFRSNGMTPTLFSAIVYKTCVDSTEDVRAKKEWM